MQKQTDLAKKRVVIVGGGFGGLSVAKKLGGTDCEVILIDRRNHHTFQPLLYQVASSVLSPGNIAMPLRLILRNHRNVEVVLGEVVQLDPSGKEVRLESGENVPYDVLVLAAGARHSYFGNDSWSEYAPGLKSIEDATEMRRRILLAFEKAESEMFLHGKTEPLTFVIVGGGPTGVELAGAIADIARHVVAKDFRTIDTTLTRVLLLEGGPRILQSYIPELSQRAQKQIEDLGVEVRTGARVTDIRMNQVFIGEECIEASVILWASGVMASSLGKQTGGEIDKSGRVLVAPDLSVEGNQEIYVIGDMCRLKDTHGIAVPGLGAAAVQMGTWTAENILRKFNGQPTLPFTYKDKGSMATIGRSKAIAQIGKLNLSGFIAWLVWCFVHIYLLIGFRNRLRVFMEWASAYVRNDFSVRLITGPSTGFNKDDPGNC